MQPKPDLQAAFKQFYDQIRTYLEQKLFNEAGILCQQFLLQYPNSAEAHQISGIIAQNQGDFQGALNAYQKALEIRPDFTTAYINLGNLYTQQKNWHDAIFTYQTALRLSPSLPSVYLQLGKAFSHLNRWQEAAIAYEHAIQLKANLPESHLGLGLALAQQGQWQRAISAYEKCLKFQPNYAAAYQKLGDAWFKLQRWESAISAYQTLLKLRPKSVWAYQHLGKLWIHQQQWDQAVLACQKAIELNPDSAWSYSNLADALVEKQEFTAATLAYLKAVQIQPSRFQPGVLNTIYRNLGNAIRQQLQVYPEPQLEQLTEQYYYIFKSYIFQSGSGLEKLVPANLINPLKFSFITVKSYLELADSLTKTSQFEAATLLCQVLLKFQPDQLEIRTEIWMEVQAEIQTRLSQLIQNQAVFKQQLETYYDKIKRYPNEPTAYQAIGNFLTDQGREQEAISYHQKSLLLQGWSLSKTRHYQFTRDWFSPNMPIWQEHLANLANRANIQVLEIGSFQGMSTCWLLDHILTHPTARITCIDPYFKPEFTPNLVRTGVPDKVMPLIGYSQDILGTLDPETYDLIYIDGCHLASVALQDALLSWPLAKVEGLIIFDDYNVLEQDNPEQTAKFGIDQFLQLVETEIKILSQDYQLIIQKQSPGFTPAEIAHHLSQIPQDDQLRW